LNLFLISLTAGRPEPNPGGISRWINAARITLVPAELPVHLRIDKRSGELFGVVGRTAFSQLVSEVFGMIRGNVHQANHGCWIFPRAAVVAKNATTENRFNLGTILPFAERRKLLICPLFIVLCSLNE
jgi:hypothetical protein